MKQIYKTSDGKEFTDEESARLHEELIRAERDFNRAKDFLARKLYETQFTADGFPFNSGHWNYYSVMGGISNKPYTQEISINQWRFSFDSGGFLELIYEDGKEERRKIDFKSLYYKRENAEKKRKEMLAKYIESLKKELE